MATKRAEHDPIHRDGERHDDAEAQEDPDPDGPTALVREGERVGTGHHELAVGEVDEAEDAEDQADADRHQRIDAAEPECIGKCLPVGAEHGRHERHEKYADTSVSLSPAASGPSVRRRRPFDSTCERSARATVRCARCSTSKIARPRSRISWRASNTTFTSRGARPSEGSSRSKTCGSATSALAIASCCCSPPESAPAWRLRNSCTTGTPARATSSGLLPRTDRPCRRTSPAALGTRPMIACSVDDLPAPFGPIKPTISPRSTVSDSPRTA